MKAKLILTTSMLVVLFTSCLKDTTYKTYTIYRPEYSVEQYVKNAAHLQKPEALKDLGNFALYKNMMFINERNRGIHVIDCANPSAPVNKGFIPIPGNQGMSIKNDILYADCYSELFVLKIISSENIHFSNAISNVFHARMVGNNYDTNYVKVRYITKDTTVTEDYYNQHYSEFHTRTDGITTMQSNNVISPGGTSVGSSMAVFAIVNDYLYTVDNIRLSTFSLKDPLNPKFENRQDVIAGVETIFPFKDKLFIGTRTGMFIYSIVTPASPSYLSQFQHVRVCDPVIADDKFAFVTLRNGSQCGGFVNQLDVLNIETITSPTKIASFPFSNPHGLSKDGNVLFLCDGATGLKVIDATNPANLITKQSIPGQHATDVIALNQIAYVMCRDAIQIYSYNQQFNVQLLSAITKN